MTGRSMTSYANHKHILDCLKERNTEIAAKNKRIAELERCLGGPDIAECILQNREDERRKVAKEIVGLIAYNYDLSCNHTALEISNGIKGKFLQAEDKPL